MDIEETYDKIYRYVYFKLKNQSVAEDITQETFLKYISAKGNIQSYEIRYLYTIARNLCIDEFRRVKPDPLPEDFEGPATDTHKTIEDRLAVRQALKKLDAEDQELLLLRHVNGESVGTICSMLKISRFAVYRRIRNAEERLRISLEGIKDEK
ncbi:MAG: RNA polymerase sigma factor [Clostridiales bacterium]|nr:RNA polymerase sigma factor [Clostridiales bacterium]